MYKRYEDACKQAGLSEEKIEEIRRLFDADKKRLKRRRNAMSKAGITWIRTGVIDMDELNCEDDIFNAIPDPCIDVEDEAIMNCEIQKLRKLLSEFSKEDREFLLDCFSGYRDVEIRVSLKYGISRNAVQYRRRQLLAKLKNIY